MIVSNNTFDSFYKFKIKKQNFTIVIVFLNCTTFSEIIIQDSSFTILSNQISGITHYNLFNSGIIGFLFNILDVSDFITLDATIILELNTIEIGFIIKLNLYLT